MTVPRPRVEQVLNPSAILASSNLTGAVTDIDEVITSPANPILGKTLVFNEDFIDLSGIDMADARTQGFNFYRKQWFTGGPTPTASITQPSSSIVRLGQRPGTNYFNERGRIQTAASTSETDGTWFGRAFGGGISTYFEIRMKWSVPQVTIVSGHQFGIYLFPIEILADIDNNGASLWPGQTFSHFTEVDIFEFAGTGVDGTTYAGKSNYQTTLSDWKGVAGGYTRFYNSNTPTSIGYIADWNKFHTYGALWTRQPSLTVPGSMAFYFDGELISGATIYWKNANWPNPPTWPGSYPTTPQDRSTPASADDYFSIIDYQYLALQLDGDTECGMDVDWVRVWH